MIRLAPQQLNDNEVRILQRLQTQINNRPTFNDKVQTAQGLWDGKNDAEARREAFKVIKDTLHKMCVFKGVCNYCEQNEAADIEHIFPKSFFPQFTFDWENYILACKQCNTGYKLDKVSVLDNNDDLVKLIRHSVPPSDRIAFINIRTEDPDNFMILNTASFTFFLLPGLNKQNENKAKSTLDILELNERDTLIAARRSAARHYYETLERLTWILGARDIETLQNILTPYDDRFDLNRPLDEIKNEIKESTKAYIAKCQHPSVWRAIKIVESQKNKKWAQLFERIQEALEW